MSMSITSIAVSALLAIVAVAAQAQDPRYDNGPGYANEMPRNDAIECRSQNYSFRRCPVTWRDVRIVRQLSDTQCVRGMNWGIDRGGVWVDRGCGALFADRHGRGDYEESGGWRPPSGWDQRFQVRCDSNDYQYNFCAVDLGGRGRAYLARQISGSPCIEGQTWGWNRAGIWVVQGCAGTFTIDRRWR